MSVLQHTWTSCVTRPSWTLDVYVFLAILDHRIVVLSLHVFYSAIEELEKEGFARMVRHYPYITIALESLEVHLLMPAKLKNSRSNAVQCWRMIQTMDWLRRCRERPSLETRASGLGLTHLNSDGSIPPLAFTTGMADRHVWPAHVCSLQCIFNNWPTDSAVLHFHHRGKLRWQKRKHCMYRRE